MAARQQHLLILSETQELITAEAETSRKQLSPHDAVRPSEITGKRELLSDRDWICVSREV